MPNVARYDSCARDRVVQSQWPSTAGPFLKIGDELPARRIDPEEVVHVDIRALGFGAPLRDQRHSTRDPSRTGTRADTCARPLEPRLQRELRGAQARRRTERHVLAGPVQLERG